MWAAIWDRAGLQNRPARFNSSAACEDLESAPRGGELVPKTRVTFGSEVRFLRSPQVRRGDEVPVGSAHRPATPASARAPRVRLSPSPPSGPAWVSGGEPSPGLARSSVEVAKTVRPPTATRCTRGSRGSGRVTGTLSGFLCCPIPALDSHGFAPKVFKAARRLASSEERVRFPLGAHNARVADRSEAPAFQAGEAGSIPAACSVCSAGWVGARAGLISRTPSVRFRPLQL